MSKLLKEVGGRHYVAGGLECDYWDGSLCCEGGKLQDPGNPEVEYGACPKCAGTGLLPVDQWIDARKAEWLKKELDNNVWISPDKKEWVVIHADANAYWLRDEPLAINKDFSQALTLAVIAVAKEG